MKSLERLKQNKKRIVFIVQGFLCLSILLFPGEKKEINRIFEGKKIVKISTVSGDCIIRKGKGSSIQLKVVYTYEKDSIKPEIREEGDTLILKEKFKESSPSGYSTWNLIVPDNTKIKVSTVSGEVSVKTLKGDVSANTVSGDITIENCSGDIGIKSVSGDIEVKNLSGELDFHSVSGDCKFFKISGDIDVKCVSGDLEGKILEGIASIKLSSGDIDIEGVKGGLKVVTASGDIDVSGVILDKNSMFKSASGRVYLKLAKSLTNDLVLASASGNVILNYDGNPVLGYFEFSARANRGNIVSPFKFEKEEEEFRHGQKYIIKCFKKGGNSPLVKIKTASGKAVLEK